MDAALMYTFAGAVHGCPGERHGVARIAARHAAAADAPEIGCSTHAAAVRMMSSGTGGAG